MPDIIKEVQENDTLLTAGEREPRYPFGTTLNFDDEMVEALGLDNMEPGAEIELVITGFVQSKSEHKDEDKTHVSVTIQMTSVYPHGEGKSDHNTDHNTGHGDKAGRLYKG